jgi:hypothetical protein
MPWDGGEEWLGIIFERSKSNQPRLCKAIKRKKQGWKEHLIVTTFEKPES